MLPVISRLANLARFGFGDRGRQRKQAFREEQRQKAFESERWDRSGAVVRRNYGSYDEYLAHQSAKLAQVSERLAETEAKDLAEFERRFALCEELRACRTALCLGARRGTEVQALHRRGLFAVGIDLNPGPNNRLVLPGDFHALVFPEASVDVVYTNALDHAFDLGKLLAEVRRVLRPGGILIADVLDGFAEGFTPGEYEALHWRDIETLCARIVEIGALELVTRRPLGHTRRNRWTQVVFRKPT